MNKTININPDFFKISPSGGRKTQKKRNDDTSSSFKIKSPTNKEKNKTSKRALLKFIKNHQERNLKKMMTEESATSSSFSNKEKTSSGPEEETQFNNEFEESLKYLMNISKEHNLKKEHNNNQTIKNYDNVSLQLPHELMNVSLPPNIVSSTITLPPPQNTISLREPYYGCLKNGKLPTYKQYTRSLKKYYPSPSTQYYTTQQQYPIQQQQYPIIQQQQYPIQQQQYPIQQQQYHTQYSPTISTSSENEVTKSENVPIETSLTKTPENKQKEKEHFRKKHERNLLNEKKKKFPQLTYMKQKKTTKKIYQLGKSKVQPKVSVLISNKTIRNNISLKSQQLKQIPITDIKKYLLKHGFIKVGSTAPNDVLRKMFESAIMMCGEINNHNPDNLLYNYLNDETLFSPNL